MVAKTLTRSFAGGEISPQLFGRLDLDKFQTGLALCENFDVQPQGPIENRAGYEYVLAAKYWDRTTVLIPFSYNTQQTFALEFGHNYIRFHTQGATLLENAKSIDAVTAGAPAVFKIVAHGFAIGQTVRIGEVPGVPSVSNRWVVVNTAPSVDTVTFKDLWGTLLTAPDAAGFLTPGTAARVYEVVTDFDQADLQDMHWVQSADVLTLTHPNYTPRELRRYGALDWRLQAIQFASSLAPPATSSIPPTAITHEYAVSAVVQGYSLTALSAPATCSNDLTIPGYVNVVAWGTVPGGLMYHIYKRKGTAWGWIGVAPSGQTFIDDGSVVPDTTVDVYAGVGAGPVISATPVAPVGTGVTVTPTGAGTTTYQYVVTSLDDQGAEESIASGAATASNDLSISGNLNTVRWPAVPGVGKYGVYRKIAGVFARIGIADSSCTFVDQNIQPDASTTPPLQINPFQGDGNYPRAVSYFEQRRVFAGTTNNPQTVWATRSGTERNLGYSFPSRDDDSITARVVAREAQTVRHIVPLGDLLLLTSGGEWLVKPAGSDVLTPASFSVKPQGYVGASEVQPAVTSRTVLYAADRGGHIREIAFAWQSQGYDTSDVSILAPHLFDYHTVKRMAFSRAPRPCLWSVREDGVMLGLTYLPEHEVRAWQRHSTNGSFESVCVVAEGDEDAVYVVVRRFINGQTVRYVERLHTRRFDTGADAFFVDSGATYRGSAASSFTGLYHLEGQKVSILADGGVSPPQTVVNGTVTLDSPASVVHAGLQIVARAQTLPLALQTQAFGQGVVKNINKVQMRVYRSQAMMAGPSFEKLRKYPTRLDEVYGVAPDLISDEVPITLDPMWQRGGQVCIQQEDPLPVTVLSMTLELEAGG